MSTLTTVDALEKAVGGRPPTFHLKSIPDLDPHSEAFLAESPFAVLGVVAGDGTLRTVALGGAPGAFAPAGLTRLSLPSLAGLDVPDGSAAGLLALVPGYGETLRVNGRLRTGAEPHIEVEEVFLHCAKAIIRSKLWGSGAIAGDTESADPTSTSEVLTSGSSLDDPLVGEVLAQAPFVLLSSVDADGFADVSPKGDPAGFLLTLDAHTLAIPDRPGNRRTDTLHNLISRTDIGVLALTPGDDRVVEIRGQARVTDDPDVLARMEVNAKVPKAAVVIDVRHVEVRRDSALAQASLWDAARHVAPGTLPKGAKVWVDHVKRNQDPGLAAKAARKIVNEKMMTKGIASDYENNLY